MGSVFGCGSGRRRRRGGVWGRVGWRGCGAVSVGVQSGRVECEGFLRVWVMTVGVVWGILEVRTGTGNLYRCRGWCKQTTPSLWPNRQTNLFRGDDPVSQGGPPLWEASDLILVLSPAAVRALRWGRDWVDDPGPDHPHQKAMSHTEAYANTPRPASVTGTPGRAITDSVSGSTEHHVHGDQQHEHPPRSSTTVRGRATAPVRAPPCAQEAQPPGRRTQGNERTPGGDTATRCPPGQPGRPRLFRQSRKATAASPAGTARPDLGSRRSDAAWPGEGEGPRVEARCGGIPNDRLRQCERR